MTLTFDTLTMTYHDQLRLANHYVSSHTENPSNGREIIIDWSSNRYLVIFLEISLEVYVTCCLFFFRQNVGEYQKQKLPAIKHLVFIDINQNGSVLKNTKTNKGNIFTCIQLWDSVTIYNVVCSFLFQNWSFALEMSVLSIVFKILL